MEQLNLRTHLLAKNLKLSILLAVSIALISCGGGGGNDSSATNGAPNPQTNENDSIDSTATGTSDIEIPEMIISANAPPMMKEFTIRMLKFGKTWGEYLQTEPNAKKRITHAYYDSARTFYQIAEFTGQKQPWLTYARTARNVIVNDYLKPNKYKPAGWWIFPHGLDLDWRVGGNANSLTDLLTLKNNLARAGLEPKTERWWKQMYSRPVAYNIETHMAAERAGETRDTAVVDTLVDMALGHITAWTTGVFLDPAPEDQHVQAFMTGLTTSALIDYYERSIELGAPDERIPLAVKKMADWLWANMWVSDVGGSGGAWNDKGGTGFGTFRFRMAKVQGNPNPAPMVAQLIVPMYAFVYKHYCNVQYRYKADLVFSGGVGLITYFGKGKFFNQQHRSVFKYFKLREDGDAANCR